MGGCSSPDNLNTLKYTLKLNDAMNGIEVLLTYTPRNIEGNIKLNIPNERNELDTLVLVNNIELLSKGELVKINSETYQYIGNENAIQLKYFIPSFSNNSNYLSCENEDYYMPYITKNFLHLFGEKSLILPTPNYSTDEIFDLELEWLNFPEKWELANDFGISEKNNTGRNLQQVKNIKTTSIGETLFFGGNYRRSQFKVNDINFHTFIYGQFKFSDEALVNQLEIIASEGLAFWNSFDHSKDYVISLTQRGNECGRISGRNMYNSFSMYLSTKFTKEQLPRVFAHSLTHEFIHTWIGTDLIRDTPDWKHMKWLIEGFTEYYAALINVKVNLLPERKFKTLLSNYYINYRRSPYAESTLQYYVENYTSDTSLERFVYNKGAVFAFYLDGYIREKSNLTFDLNDFMFALLASKQKINEALNFEMMNSIAIQSVGIDISDILNKHIIEGKTFPMSSPLVDSYTEFKTLPIDYGFDLVESTTNEIISGVNENAFKSGLRNGQKIVAIKNLSNSTKDKMILEVKDNNEIITVKYYPIGTEIKFNVIKELKPIN